MLSVIQVPQGFPVLLGGRYMCGCQLLVSETSTIKLLTFAA